MPRKESEAVPEGNSPVPQREEFGSGQPTLADVYRPLQERLDRQQLKLMIAISINRRKVGRAHGDDETFGTALSRPGARC